MSRLEKRIAVLENRAVPGVSDSNASAKLLSEIETIASRLEWDAISPAWAKKQSLITIIATVLHGPLPAIEAVYPKFVELSERKDAVGRLSRSILEYAQ